MPQDASMAVTADRHHQPLCANSILAAKETMDRPIFRATDRSVTSSFPMEMFCPTFENLSTRTNNPAA
jgi:hypothetical protein